MAVFKKIKELARNRFKPLHLCAGDTIQVTYRDGDKETVLCKTEATPAQTMVFDEAIVFSAEIDGRRALGGAAIEEKKK